MFSCLSHVLNLQSAWNETTVKKETVGATTAHLPGGHDVVVVDDLDERLDLGTLSDALLAHVLGDLEGVTLNTGNKGVAITTLLGSLIDM